MSIFLFRPRCSTPLPISAEGRTPSEERSVVRLATMFVRERVEGSRSVPHRRVALFHRVCSFHEPAACGFAFVPLLRPPEVFILAPPVLV